MTPIALLRHFPTAWNAEQRLQGRTDVPLSAEARANLADLRMPMPWRGARLVSSPLSRALETADLLADGRTVETDPDLVEISWGAWEGKQAHALLGDPSSGFRPTHEWDLDTAAPGGESMREAMERARPALARLAATGTRAVIVTHKALMRVILGTACDWVRPPEIRRGRLYPLVVRDSGLPRRPEEPVRLESRL